MNFSKINLTIIALTASTYVWAGTVTTPNTFEAGKPAVAAEVNENFSALEGMVNTNDHLTATNTSDIANLSAQIDAINTRPISEVPSMRLLSTVVDANGNKVQKVVGRVVGISILYDSSRNRKKNKVNVMSDKGYIQSVDLKSGLATTAMLLYFESNNCTGQPYLITEQVNGKVFRVYTNLNREIPFEDRVALFYIEKNSLSVEVSLNSTSSSLEDYTNGWGYCDNSVTAYTKNAYPIIPNDPNKTGFTDVRLPRPLTINFQ